MSNRDELARAIRVGFFGMTDGDLDEEDRQMADAVLSSDWLARVKREAAAEAWWEGVNDQWKHRPIGGRVLETANPHRKKAD